MLTRPLLSLLTLLGAIAAPKMLHAGACTEGDDRYYVARVEKLARGKRLSREGDNPFYCLDLRFGMTNRWAGPRAAAKIKRYRRSPYRKRIARACARLIARKRPREYAQACVKLLAAYGVRQSKTKSTYRIASELFAFGLDSQHLAALGDTAAVPELLRRFRQPKSCREVWSDGKVTPSCIDFARGKRNRWTRKAHREHKISVLNALWHLASPTTEGFLEEIARTDPDALLRERAKRVLTRLRELRKEKSTGR